jgi:hypothetical protein
LDHGIDVFHVVLILGYLVALGWYLYFIWSKKQSHERSRNWGHRGGETKDSGHRRGKRCPQCRNMIDQRRTVCQHCGHEFELVPGREAHPDEIAAGKRQPPDKETDAAG